MDTKQIIQQMIEKEGYILGCYDKGLQKLNKGQLNRIIKKSLNIEYGDITVFINRKKYIVEVATVGNEKDYNLLSLSEYKNIYGDNK